MALLAALALLAIVGVAHAQTTVNTDVTQLAVVQPALSADDTIVITGRSVSRTAEVAHASYSTDCSFGHADPICRLVATLCTNVAVPYNK